MEYAKEMTLEEKLKEIKEENEFVDVVCYGDMNGETIYEFLREDDEFSVNETPAMIAVNKNGEIRIVYDFMEILDIDEYFDNDVSRETQIR